MATFGEKLRALMAERQISQRKLAKLVPCDDGHLSKIANGRKRPSPELAKRLDHLLEADGEAFIADLKQWMTAGLDRLTAALADGSAGGVRVTSRHGEPWISVPKLEPLEEPTGLQALKDEVMRRWGVLDLLDVLKNADFLTGFTEEFASVAAYERIDRAVLQRRLLLALFALGTNMGIRAIVATGEHGESEAALRHVRRHFITVDNLRAAVRKLVNATFAARDTAWWGRGTACASDSKKFGSRSSQVLRRFTRGGLQVVENWNSANTVLRYGKDGALTGPDKEHAETSMLALHLLQSALVHVNTLLVQRVLAEPA
ncbi:Tn3 family transposase [Actinomadura formosensis]|uniref:Tn3 family transposase n=1 Tax=Actinomadura formosensis TaxID=60706 RepID=UPI00083649AF|nr:Tn3 family transposase [Actinomadura formosensis]